MVTRSDAELVTAGRYRFVRHPFYLAFFLLVTANALCTAKLFVALTGYAAFAAIAVRVRTEERFLIDRFGARYSDYAATTARFFPWRVASRRRDA